MKETIVTASVNNAGGVNILFQSGSRVKAIASLSVEEAKKLMANILRALREVSE